MCDWNICFFLNPKLKYFDVLQDGAEHIELSTFQPSSGQIEVSLMLDFDTLCNALKIFLVCCEIQHKILVFSCRRRRGNKENKLKTTTHRTSDLQLKRRKFAPSIKQALILR